ncbi:MAG: hypothetical protein VR73_07330 [Gammaproteobacteria bacterium BRH_c0]|nr:MAG: hypothetical protein VR73_07330 [Gammaproteobacteria bacterium BRH_c0]
MSGFRRWAARALMVLAGLALLLVFTLYLLLDTRRGTHWLLELALPQAQFESLTGTLSRGIRISGFELSLDAVDIRIGQLQGQWSLLDVLGGQLPIQRLAVTDLSITLHPSAEPSEPGPWPSLALPFPVNLAAGEISNLSITQGEDTQHIDHIALQANSGPLQLHIIRLKVTRNGDEGDANLSLSGRIGNSAPYPFELAIDWDLAPPDAAPVAGRGTVSGNLAAFRLDHELLQPYAVGTSGEASLAFDPQRASIDPATIHLTLDNQWSKLKLPLEQAVESEGTLHISGSWDSYQFELQSRLTGLPDQNRPAPEEEAEGTLDTIVAATLAEPGHIQASGSGQQLQLELTQLRVDTTAGKIAASGQFDGGQPLSWVLKLSVSELQAGLFAPDWPAVISTDLQTRGQWQGQEYQATLAIASLNGDIFGETIAGHGDISLSNERQVIDKLTLSLGDNSINIDGEIADTLALNWQLEAPDLAQIYPPIAGAATATGSLSGTLDEPAITALLSGRNLRYRDYRVDAINLNLATEPQGNMDLDLSVPGIKAALLENGKLTVRGLGSLQQHRLDATLTDNDNSLTLTLAGGLDTVNATTSWQGQITALNLDNPRTGPWQLVKPTGLEAAADAVNLESLCLTQDQGKLCAAFQLQQSAITLAGTIDELPLTRVISPLPEGAAIQGAINSRFELQGPLQSPQGNLSLSVDPIRLGYQAPGEGESLEYNATLSANAVLDGSGLNASMDFNVADVGVVKARIGSPAGAGANPLQRPMAGSVTGRFDNLLWLDGLFPQLEQLSGQLDLDLSINGTPAAPLVSGTLQAQQLEMGVPMAGIELEQGHLSLALENPGTWHLAGGATSGAGSLTLGGNGNLDTSTGPSGQLTVAGENFTLMDLPDTMLLVSPDLSIDIEPQVIKVRGDIDIPDGRFIIKTLSEQAVEVSADERIDPSDSKPQAPGRTLNTRVQLSLNDSFRFEGFGIATRLGGQLRLSQRGTAPPQATGTLSLYDGVYEAYGQELKVQQGLLIFQGPLDNPGLNITAVRKTPDATVGIRIGGTAQDIRSEIFSTPALPSTDAVAILITGKAPSEMSESDANQVVNAAAALGISQSEWITSRLQSTFGLDVLNLQGGDEYLDSSLIVGKYLTPDLFISYVQNLFTPAGSVQLEYSLTRYLGLKASSGETQSVDLLYKMEH